MTCVLALDPGQTGDAAALVALRATGHRDLTRWATWETVSVLTVRHLTYTALAELTAGLGYDLADNGLGVPLTVVDNTGIGRAVTELLAAQQPAGPLVAITYTAGERVTYPPSSLPGVTHWGVPKWLMVEHLQSALQHQALTIPPSTPGGPLLVQELKSFAHLGTTARGRARTGTLGSDHDDTVTALATALFAGDSVYAEGPRG